ncbi:mRNA export factor MEX67, partial [Striga asiatica]
KESICIYKYTEENRKINYKDFEFYSIIIPKLKNKSLKNGTFQHDKRAQTWKHALGIACSLVWLYSVPMYNDQSKISTLECGFHDRTVRGSYSRHSEVRTSLTFLPILQGNMLYKIRTFIIVENKMTYKATIAPY